MPDAGARADHGRGGLKIALVLLVACGLLGAHHFGLLAAFGEPAGMKQVLVGMGPWGYLAFVVAYALLQPFGVPGTVFVFGSALIWPWPEAFALSMVGTMAASVIGFSFARFVARDWIASKVPARFHAYDEALARRGFMTVATLRFIFWMPQLLHAFLGISKVGFWTHFWGSLVGYFVPLLLCVYFGERVFQALLNAPPSVWLVLAALTLLIVLGARHGLGARSQSGESPPG